MLKNKTPKRPKGRKTPQQKRRQARITTVIIGVLASLSMAALALLPKMMQKDTTPMVDTQEVKKENVTSHLEVSGTVKSLKTKTYYSPVNATVKDYTAKAGQLVRAGTMLVSFETDSLERDNQKAGYSRSITINNNQDLLDKAYKAQAEANAAQGNAQIIQGDVDRYKDYIDSLKQAISERTIQLSQQAYVSEEALRQDQDRKTAALKQALEFATQIEKLKTQNDSCQTEVDSLTIAKSQAEFEGDSNTAKTIEEQINKKVQTIKSNQKAIDKMEGKMGKYAGVSAADIQKMLEGASAPEETTLTADTKNTTSDKQLTQWQLDLENAQTTLAELQSDLAQEKGKADAGDTAAIGGAARKAMESNNNLADMESATQEELLEKGRRGIKAEFNGIITKAELSQGIQAAQGMELVSVASNDDVAVEVTVSKYDYGKLKVGQKAKVTIGDNKYQGTVGDISRVAQKNEKGAPVITCEVNIDNPDDNIFLGVEAKASILTGSEKNVLTVPMEAVNTGKDSTFCYVLVEGKIARRDVVAGISSDTRTEIRKGLKEGELVIPQLTEGLKEGSPAKSKHAEGGQEGADGADG